MRIQYVTTVEAMKKSDQMWIQLQLDRVVVSSLEGGFPDADTFVLATFPKGADLNISQEVSCRPSQSSGLFEGNDSGTFLFAVSRDATSPHYGSAKSLEHIGDDQIWRTFRSIYNR